MRRISIPTAEAIIAINKLVCEEGGTRHHCNDRGKIESAIHTAFYPGSFPFVGLFLAILKKFGFIKKNLNG